MPNVCSCATTCKKNYYITINSLVQATDENRNKLLNKLFLLHPSSPFYTDTLRLWRFALLSSLAKVYCGETLG